MATEQTAQDYANGRVQTLTYTDDAGTKVTNVNSYTIATFDYSRMPNKPATITEPMWWDVAHQGQESSMNPTYFADTLFKMRSYPEDVPSRPVTLHENTLSRVVFNKIKL